jgi:hypothetical protein
MSTGARGGAYDLLGAPATPRWRIRLRACRGCCGHSPT